VQEKITFGDGYSSQTCSDPDAANKLAPYCAFKQTWLLPPLKLVAMIQLKYC
jgi:hypothetical protein